MKHPDVRRVELVRRFQIGPRLVELVRIPAPRGAAPQDLGLEPLRTERLLRRDAHQSVVHRNGFVEAAVGDEDARQRAQRVRLIGDRGKHVAVFALGGAMVAASEVQIRDPELRAPAFAGGCVPDRFRELRLCLCVAPRIARGASVTHQPPEGERAQRLFPDVAPLRRQPPRLLEQRACAGEVVLALGLQRLALRDQRQAHPCVGVVPRHLEHRLGITQVAALERRVSRFLCLADAAVAHQGEATLRVGIVARRVEEPLRVAQVASVERGVALGDRPGHPSSLDVPGDLRVVRMRARVRAQERQVLLVGRKPEKRLTPARGGFLPDRRIARERREEIDAFTPRLLAVRVVLRQRKTIARLVRSAAHDAAQSVTSLVPPARCAPDGLVVLESEIAGRPGIAEQLAVPRGRFRAISLVRELARLREERHESCPELDRAAQDGQVGVRGSELLQLRHRLARLLQPAGAGVEGTDRGQRIGIVGRRFEHLLPRVLGLVGPRARLPVPGVPHQPVYDGVVGSKRRHRGDRRSEHRGDQRSRPRHCVSHEVCRVPSASKRKRASRNPRAKRIRFWS